MIAKTIIAAAAGFCLGSAWTLWLLNRRYAHQKEGKVSLFFEKIKAFVENIIR